MATREAQELFCQRSFVLKSIGYKSVPVDGLPFDHHKGKLERTAILKAICAEFQETADPPICLSGALETNECLERNGGCWSDSTSNITACKDTFRGRICECPVANSVQYRGYGYKSCEGVIGRIWRSIHIHAKEKSGQGNHFSYACQQKTDGYTGPNS